MCRKREHSVAPATFSHFAGVQTTGCAGLVNRSTRSKGIVRSRPLPTESRSVRGPSKTFRESCWGSPWSGMAWRFFGNEARDNCLCVPIGGGMVVSGDSIHLLRSSNVEKCSFGEGWFDTFMGGKLPPLLTRRVWPSRWS